MFDYDLCREQVEKWKNSVKMQATGLKKVCQTAYK